jgi:hypothetical protein
VTDQRTPAELAIVADRIVEAPIAAVEPVSYTAPVALHERTTAMLLAADIESGDAVSVRLRVHALEHRTSPFDADPWRTLTELAEVLISRRAGQAQPVAEPAPATVPASGVPETTADAAG